MKQPELGKKISQIRNSKGLTQEALVEKCNISVRTIQRIENGEVTPRSYTVKAIMEALEYDLNQGKPDEDNVDILKQLRKFVLVDIDPEKPSIFLINQLNLAWVLGIGYFLLGFFEGIADYYRFDEGSMLINRELYIVLKVLVFVTYLFFLRGFILIGGLFKSDLLKVIPIILILCLGLIFSYDITTLYYPEIEYEFVFISFSITFGILGIMFGYALMTLQKPLGNLAQYAGVLEILMGVCLLTVILSPLALFLSIPIELFEVLLIFRTIRLIKSKQESSEVIK
jgi:transcriptional regulator with XRE-family HTH domain